MPVKKPSLNHQLHKRLESLKLFGESKHKAKAEAKISGRENLVGIYSENTLKVYKTASKQIAEFLKEQGIKNINDVSEDLVIEYFGTIKDQYSSYTLDTKLSAMNKIFGFSITKAQANLPKTSYKDVFRGRRGQKGRYNAEIWKDHVDIAKATGLRRASMSAGQYPIKASSFFFYEGRLYVRLLEKGGRYREAVVLHSMESRVLEVVQQRTGKEIEKGHRYDKGQFLKHYRLNRHEPKIFENYTKEINNHAYRRMYAEKRYEEILKSLGRQEEINFRGYDKEVLSLLTRDLGHNRIRVCVEHYLR